MREADNLGYHVCACLVAVRLAAALPEAQFTHVREQLRESKMFEALPAPETFARYVSLGKLLIFAERRQARAP